MTASRNGAIVSTTSAPPAVEDARALCGARSLGERDDVVRGRAIGNGWRRRRAASRTVMPMARTGRPRTAPPMAAPSRHRPMAAASLRRPPRRGRWPGVDPGSAASEGAVGPHGDGGAVDGWTAGATVGEVAGSPGPGSAAVVDTGASNANTRTATWQSTRPLVPRSRALPSCKSPEADDSRRAIVAASAA